MKADRLFNILMILSGQNKISSAALAHKLGVSVRTIYRDIDVLSQAGIPVYVTTGRMGGIHLMEGYVIDKAMFSRVEQQQILKTLHSFDNVPGVDLSMVRTKFTNIFKKTEYKEHWLEIHLSGWQDSDDNGFLKIIENSIENYYCLHISYINAAGEIKERVTEPIKLVFRKRDWYLYAFCQLQQDYRWFKISRIMNYKLLTEKPFSKQNHHYTPYDNFVKESDKLRLELLFPIKMAYLVYDLFDKNDVSRENDHQLRVSTNYPVSPWLYHLLMMFGPDVTIVEPTGLRKAILNKHQEAIEHLNKKG